MAKTYTAGGTVSAGDVATAAAWNVLTVNTNNLIVPPACVLQQTAAQAIPSATNQLKAFGTATVDTDGMATTGASARITLKTAGLYIISVGIGFSTSSAGSFRGVVIRKNGSGSFTVPTGNEVMLLSVPALSASSSTTVTQTVLQSFAADDYVDVIVFQDRGSDLNTTSQSCANFLSAMWVGRTS